MEIACSGFVFFVGKPRNGGNPAGGSRCGFCSGSQWLWKCYHPIKTMAKFLPIDRRWPGFFVSKPRVSWNSSPFSIKTIRFFAKLFKRRPIFCMRTANFVGFPFSHGNRLLRLRIFCRKTAKYWYSLPEQSAEDFAAAPNGSENDIISLKPWPNFCRAAANNPNFSSQNREFHEIPPLLS